MRFAAHPPRHIQAPDAPGRRGWHFDTTLRRVVDNPVGREALRVHLQAASSGQASLTEFRLNPIHQMPRLNS